MGRNLVLDTLRNYLDSGKLDALIPPKYLELYTDAKPLVIRLCDIYRQMPIEQVRALFTGKLKTRAAVYAWMEQFQRHLAKSDPLLRAELCKMIEKHEPVVQSL